jgi:hypothetical protein
MEHRASLGSWQVLPIPAGEVTTVMSCSHSLGLDSDHFVMTHFLLLTGVTHLLLPLLGLSSCPTSPSALGGWDPGED